MWMVLRTFFTDGSNSLGKLSFSCKDCMHSKSSGFVKSRTAWSTNTSVLERLVCSMCCSNKPQVPSNRNNMFSETTLRTNYSASSQRTYSKGEMPSGIEAWQEVSNFWDTFSHHPGATHLSLASGSRSQSLWTCNATGPKHQQADQYCRQQSLASLGTPQWLQLRWAHCSCNRLTQVVRICSKFGVSSSRSHHQATCAHLPLSPLEIYHPFLAQQVSLCWQTLLELAASFELLLSPLFVPWTSMVRVGAIFAYNLKIYYSISNIYIPICLLIWSNLIWSNHLIYLTMKLGILGKSVAKHCK